MKIHNYLITLKRILSVWSEFSIYSERQSKFHFLICHKVFWAYLRQGLLKKEVKVSFAPMVSHYPNPTYLPYLHSIHIHTKKYFDKDAYVDSVLEQCGFRLVGSNITNKTIYYFKER